MPNRRTSAKNDAQRSTRAEAASGARDVTCAMVAHGDHCGRCICKPEVEGSIPFVSIA